MRAPVLAAPVRVPGLALEGMGIMSAQSLGLEANRKTIQAGGSSQAADLLSSFLRVRGREYQRQMSSPLEGWDACSRLSPHLAFGAISARVVVQAAQAAYAERRDEDPVFARSIGAFIKRLAWRCHFTQKLEDEPRLEFENANRAFDGLREPEFNLERFEAFTTGRTGYPMVDACVRCLLETGWINFRMRSMLVSFATQHLWLHWRPVGVFLARHFLDYEPGIHWPQMQMQASTTGINTVRIYNPTKQAEDQDPEGAFIRRWIPELRDVPTEYIHQPQTIPPLFSPYLAAEYPRPIVDERSAMRHARDRLYGVKRSAAARTEGSQLLERHSRQKR
jgi:deoxyribodipyrimidine photo-lyase